MKKEKQRTKEMLKISKLVLHPQRRTRTISLSCSSAQKREETPRQIQRKQKTSEVKCVEQRERFNNKERNIVLGSLKLLNIQGLHTRTIQTKITYLEGSANLNNY